MGGAAVRIMRPHPRRADGAGVPVSELMYGFFPGGDPRKFRPDVDSCTPEEIEAHRVACERANWADAYRHGKGSNAAANLECPSHHLYDTDGAWCGHVTIAPFGIGSYEYDEPYFAPAPRTAPQRGLQVVNSDPRAGGRWVAFVAGMAFRCHSLSDARGLRHYGEQPTVRRWSRRWL
jgi:hypothetical protein